MEQIHSSGPLSVRKFRWVSIVFVIFERDVFPKTRGGAVGIISGKLVNHPVRWRGNAHQSL